MLNFVSRLQSVIRQALGIDLPASKPTMKIDAAAIIRLQQEMAYKPESVRYDIKPPELPKNVVPSGQKSAIAMDSTSFDYANEHFQGQGFMGYSALSMMALRSEYSEAVRVISAECARKWIQLKSTSTDVDLAEKIAKLTEEMERLNLRDKFRIALEHDGFFGRGQIYINIDNCPPEKRGMPLVISDKTIKQGSLKGFSNIEPIWTTPQNYDTVDPASQDFYNPRAWWVLGTNTHSDRLLTIVSREVPDMLKPAYNFGGVSLIQIMQPYVERWWRTVEAVSNLVNNYSTSGIKTDMGSILQSGYQSDETAFSAAGTLLNRIRMFVETRDNRGMMILDNNSEEFFQFNVPLAGLDSLLAKAQEQMCMPCHIPLVKYTGITPSGLNASSDGEIRVFYDWIHSEQEKTMRQPLTKILQIMQLSLFGEMDNSITFDFLPLEEMTEAQEASIRQINQAVDVGYIEAGVLAPEEARVRLRAEKNSGYQNLADDVPELPEDEPDNEEKTEMNAEALAADAMTLEATVQAAIERLEGDKGQAGIPSELAKELNTRLTQSQRYPKLHTLNIGGLSIAIENPVDTIREGVDDEGKAWRVTMRDHYGYIEGCTGHDGDGLDIFLKPNTPEDWAGDVFVIEQHLGGQYDEDKCMVGYDDEDEAEAAYRANFDEDWQGFGDITRYEWDQFKALCGILHSMNS